MEIPTADTTIALERDGPIHARGPAVPLVLLGQPRPQEAWVQRGLQVPQARKARKAHQVHKVQQVQLAPQERLTAAM